MAGGSRSAKQEPGTGSNRSRGTSRRQTYIGHGTCPLAVACRRRESVCLQVAGLVLLIVVPKALGKTRRSSLEMGTLRRPCSGMGLRTRRAFHAASIGGRPVMHVMHVIFHVISVTLDGL